ncbi:MAG TPA: ThiF family adenylyltransferase [Lacipirellulaceae bacterium]|nr:ThiF family adenylyltransferase [Lacipirellulaceae bacterium]
MQDQATPDRYRRQVRFAPLGESGQRRLLASRVLICGCGALGSVAADLLVRAGVGMVRIVDRDFLEADNLHRQVLFDEADVAPAVPTAVAAAPRGRQVTSSIAVEPVVADLTAATIRQIAAGADLIVDGTDNFETRYLINDFAVETGTPWVFGGCIGAEGQALAILPGQTPCLACLIPEPPPPESQPTCETAGVIGPIVTMIASLQAAEALKILSGAMDFVNRRMSVVDLWHGDLKTIGVGRTDDSADCRACSRRDFPWLDGRRGVAAIALCGRNAVQLAPAAPGRISLPELAEKLRRVGRVTGNDYLLRLEVDEFRLTIFADGRTIVSGTSDLAEARAVHARIVGG